MASEAGPSVARDQPRGQQRNGALAHGAAEVVEAPHSCVGGAGVPRGRQPPQEVQGSRAQTRVARLVDARVRRGGPVAPRLKVVEDLVAWTGGR